jgi:hypothetical protein
MLFGAPLKTGVSQRVYGEIFAGVSGHCRASTINGWRRNSVMVGRFGSLAPQCFPFAVSELAMSAFA